MTVLRFIVVFSAQPLRLNASLVYWNLTQPLLSKSLSKSWSSSHHIRRYRTFVIVTEFLYNRRTHIALKNVFQFDSTVYNFCNWYTGNFSLHHRIQNGSGAHAASYPMGTSDSFPGDKAAGAWSWPLTSSVEVNEWVELYLHFPVHLHGVVLS
jgi:hypothetical protein